MYNELKMKFNWFLSRLFSYDFFIPLNIYVRLNSMEFMIEMIE